MELTLGWMDCVHDTTWTGIAHLESVRGRACAKVGGSSSENGKRERVLPPLPLPESKHRTALDDENPSNT